MCRTFGGRVTHFERRHDGPTIVEIEVSCPLFKYVSFICRNLRKKTHYVPGEKSHFADKLHAFFLTELLYNELIPITEAYRRTKK